MAPRRIGRSDATPRAVSDVFQPAERSLSDEIAALQKLTVDDLRARWRATGGRTAPGGLPRNLLLRMLAYKMQTELFGDLDRNSSSELEAIADRLAKLPAGEKMSAAVAPVRRRPLKPGAILVREHDGVQHRVMVMERGYAWNGETYDSLTKIARDITGTAWNGPRFFGLRAKRKQARRPELRS